jgi:hypothetical protein
LSEAAHSDIQQETFDLEKVAQESRVRLSEEKPAKAGRGGRRPGSGRKKTDGTSVGAMPGPSATHGNVGTGIGQGTVSASMAPLFSGVSKIAATSIADARNYPAYNISDDEANMIGESANEFCKVWLPDAAVQNPKVVSALSLSFALITVFGLREMKYRSEIQKVATAPKVQESRSQQVTPAATDDQTPTLKYPVGQPLDLGPMSRSL